MSPENKAPRFPVMIHQLTREADLCCEAEDQRGEGLGCQAAEAHLLRLVHHAIVPCVSPNEFNRQDPQG